MRIDSELYEQQIEHSNPKDLNEKIEKYKYEKFCTGFSNLIEFFNRVSVKLEIKSGAEYTINYKGLYNSKNNAPLKIIFIKDCLGRSIPFVFDTILKLNYKSIFIGRHSLIVLIHEGKIFEKPLFRISKDHGYLNFILSYGIERNFENSMFFQHESTIEKEKPCLVKNFIKKYKNELFCKKDKMYMFNQITQKMFFDIMELITVTESDIDTAMSLFLDFSEYLAKYEKQNEEELKKAKSISKKAKGKKGKKHKSRKNKSSKIKVTEKLEEQCEEEFVEESEHEIEELTSKEVEIDEKESETHGEDQDKIEIAPLSKDEYENNTEPEEELVIESTEDEKIDFMTEALYSHAENKKSLKKQNMIKLISKWLKHTNLYDEVNKINIKGSHVSFHINNMAVRFALPHGSSKDGASRGVMGKIARQIANIQINKVKDSGIADIKVR
ncbi:hypothetical protein [Candidatus Nesciobacter abundans]|uniref:Uncharacterized protein n=1 Tax=Candidatus Nesciobacter abundans TaxID=2601668 RepID=A0A5C0UHC1_9PROT|nr:hypothetical protein [Candidatus Nesciobacter abundans]QEK39107.1 hypothetical protein FZC36_01490 [Candidatus Nesciobacter abundans]